jgi:hypothetical protein
MSELSRNHTSSSRDEDSLLVDRLLSFKLKFAESLEWIRSRDLSSSRFAGHDVIANDRGTLAFEAEVAEEDAVLVTKESVGSSSVVGRKDLDVVFHALEVCNRGRGSSATDRVETIKKEGIGTHKFRARK